MGLNVRPETILALKGNAARGRTLFHTEGAAQCASCHRIGQEGRAFGPDLNDLRRKYSRAQLLEQLLLPSKIIAPEFKTLTVTRRDDSEVSGFVLQRNATELVLRDATLVEQRVKLSDVKESRESTLSAMPEGLLAPLTAQEVADLLDYLLKL